MIRNKHKYSYFVLVASCLLFLAMPALAESDMAAMKSRIESLEKELSEIKTILEKQVQQSATKEEVQAVKKDIEVARSEQSEWKIHDSTVHLGGYGSVNYTGDDHENDRFSRVSYSPIFHYSFKDLIMLQAELEIEVEDDGDTEIALEYMTIDWFMNDYVILQGGKFLSPLGYFRQNLHPSWINKLPTAPTGFGHDQSAPIADVGLQFRGGVPLGDTMFANYSFFVSNGPNELELNEDGDEIEAVETAGATGNEDDNFLFGGRIGFVPIANVEIGVSGAFGDVGLEDDRFADRDYDVFGVDAFGRWKGLDLRAEYIRQKVGSLAISVAPDSQEWEAWYAQASYKFSHIPYKYLRNLEAVVRYSDYDSNHADQRQEQWTLGLNYLIAPQAIAKMGYEFNDGLDGEPTDEDRLLIQLSYGF